MAKQQPLALPLIDMLTGDEVNEVIVRAILAKKGAVDLDLHLKRVTWQVSYRNVRLPNGTLSMFATAGIFAKDEPSPTDTPLPETNGNG